MEGYNIPWRQVKLINEKEKLGGVKMCKYCRCSGLFLGEYCSCIYGKVKRMEDAHEKYTGMYQRGEVKTENNFPKTETKVDNSIKIKYSLAQLNFLIDLALDTKDKEWFLELTKKGTSKAITWS